MRTCCSAMCRIGTAISLSLVPTLAAGQTCQIAPGSAWTVTGLSEFGIAKAATNLSGLACAPASNGKALCVLVQDEDFAAGIAKLTQGDIKVFRVINLPGETAAQKGEFDAEAVAYSDGFFYVLGSHSERGKTCKPNPSSRALVRFPTPSGGIGSEIVTRGRSLVPVIASVPQLKDRLGACVGTAPFPPPFATKGTQGINAEGLAVLGKRVFIGFRGPVLNGAAQVIEMDLDFVFGNASPNSKSHQLKLAPSGGVRDLASLGSDILILSGSEDDDTGKAAIHLWNGSSGSPQKLCDLPDPPRGSKDKPEALHVLSASDQAVHLLVLSDGVAGGNPREFILKRR